MAADVQPRGFSERVACLLQSAGLALVFLGDFSSETAELAFQASRSLIESAPAHSFFYALFAAIIALVAWKSRLRISSGLVVVLIGSAIFLTAVSLLLRDLGTAPLPSLATTASLALSGASLCLLWLHEVTLLPSIWLKKSIIFAILISGSLRLAAPDCLLANAWFAVGAYSCSLLLHSLSCNSRSTLQLPIEARQYATGTTPKALFGFSAIAICAGASLQLIGSSEHYSSDLYAVALIISAAIMWKALATKSFPSFSALLKVAMTLLISSFALFAAVNTLSPLIALAGLVAGSLFWFGTITLTAQACTYSKGNSFAALAGVYALLSCQGLFAPAIGMTAEALSLSSNYSLACGIIVTILTVASLWLFNEKDVDDIIAKSNYPALHKAAPYGMDRRLDELAALYSLTAKEREVVGLYAIGRSAPYIAEKLVISVHTVKSHIANIYQKLGVHSRQELISMVDEIQGPSGSPG